MLQFVCRDLALIVVSVTAFHILKDTTIQFTLEKVPLDEDSQFSFLTCDEPFNSTGLLKVDGKFVNAVQVSVIVARFSCSVPKCIKSGLIFVHTLL